MSKKRLSDTAAVAAMPGTGQDTQSMSVDVRKIENGYVTRTSTYGSDSYESRERFTKEAPKLRDPMDTRRGSHNSGSLRGAIGLLNKGG